MRKSLGNNQKKLLYLLLGGASFCLTRNPRKQLRIIRELSEDITELNKPNSERSLTALEKHKFIRLVKKRGGLEPCLTKEGRRRAYLEALNDIKLKKPKRWDEKWRVVSFDIPEKKRKKRNSFRFHLNRLGFREIHQSLFVVPYPCEDEVRYIAHQIGINPHVHTLIADEIDHEKRLKKHFNL